jgi:hypothetical protein
VHEQHLGVGLEVALSCESHEACHDLSGVDRIEQDAFGPRQHLNGFHHL